MRCGKRWRQLPNLEALLASASDSYVFVVDEVTGTVHFGDEVHGACPPTGALVRVHYRQGGGAEGNAAVSWEGRWPPRAWRLAMAIIPTSLARMSKGPLATGGSAKR